MERDLIFSGRLHGDTNRRQFRRFQRSSLESGGRQQEIPPDQQARQRQTESRHDSATLSSLGTDLARAINNDLPNVVSRIERLQEAVAAGRFSAPAEQVAEAVIEEALRGAEMENQIENPSNGSRPQPSAPSP